MTSSAVTEQKLGPILEAALLKVIFLIDSNPCLTLFSKAPQLNLRAGRVEKAIARWETALLSSKNLSISFLKHIFRPKTSQFLSSKQI